MSVESGEFHPETREIALGAQYGYDQDTYDQLAEIYAELFAVLEMGPAWQEKATRKSCPHAAQWARAKFSTISEIYVHPAAQNGFLRSGVRVL